MIEKSELNMESTDFVTPLHQEDTLKDNKNIELRYENNNIFNLIFILIYGIYLILFLNKKAFPGELNQSLDY